MDYFISRAKENVNELYKINKYKYITEIERTYWKKLKNLHTLSLSLNKHMFENRW